MTAVQGLAAAESRVAKARRAASSRPARRRRRRPPARRRAEEAERAAGRSLEAAAREAAWLRSQADRLAAELDRARGGARGHAGGGAVGLERGHGRWIGGGSGSTPATTAGPSTESDAITAWEARLAELRTRRDRLAGEAGAQDRVRRDAEARRAGAEAAASLAERRIATADGDLAALDEREQVATAERTSVAAAIAEAGAHRDARPRGARGAPGRRPGRAHAPRGRRAGSDVRTRAPARQRRPGAGVRRRGHGGAAAPRVASRAGAGRARGHGRGRAAAPGRGRRHRRTRRRRTRPRRDATADTDAQPAEGSADGSAEGAALEAALERLAPAWTVEAPQLEPPTPGRLAVLRRRFHELGAANPFAVDEYRTVRDRLETLDTQHRDLRDAIARTRSLIADLDELIATQFRATFAALEVAFDARFQQLFGGGFAKLSLTDPADLATTGIEITARPPGKKPQALAMLSGGERALTAVALLFAMLEVRPAPFCVLDEVDAALDEANVGRFTDALQALAQQTQFIVITHNRGTIEVADALYGVTVGDDSVSRVISLRLDEAQAIADDRRTEARAVLAGEPA